MVVVKSTGCHRLKVLLLFDIVGQVLEGNPSFVYTTTITITIMSVKIMIVFIVRGTYGNPVFVRCPAGAGRHALAAGINNSFLIFPLFYITL